MPMLMKHKLSYKVYIAILTVRWLDSRFTAECRPPDRLCEVIQCVFPVLVMFMKMVDSIYTEYCCIEAR